MRQQLIALAFISLFPLAFSAACASDSQCAETQQCVGGACAELRCESGEAVSNHVCVQVKAGFASAQLKRIIEAPPQILVAGIFSGLLFMAVFAVFISASVKKGLVEDAPKEPPKIAEEVVVESRRKKIERLKNRLSPENKEQK